MGFGQTDLPRHAGVLDRGLRRGACAAVVAGDQDGVGLGLGHPGRNGADAGCRHQFDRDLGVGIDRLQVVDQLSQILDRIDVVVRRRADQGRAGHGVAHPADELGDLETRQLAALAGLGALGHLDLDLAALVQVFGGDAEAARGHLFDRRVGVVAIWTRDVARRILAALAGDGARPHPVHGDVQGLMRFRRQGAQGHGLRQEAAADVRDALDLVQLDRGQAVLEVQQVA